MMQPSQNKNKHHTTPYTLRPTPEHWTISKRLSWLFLLSLSSEKKKKKQDQIHQLYTTYPPSLNPNQRQVNQLRPLDFPPSICLPVKSLSSNPP